MPYIYKITNKVNGKIYIGKTVRSLDKRWKEHCQSSRKTQCEKRPLYEAMKKYGIENFEFSLIEECDENILSEKEKYWIEYYGSFKNGYNATIGGDGKSYIDYDLVVASYKELKSCIDVAKKLNINESTVRYILKLRQENIISSPEVNKMKYGKTVNMYSKDGKYIKTFPSFSDAGQYLIDNNLTNCKLSTIRTHISEVCKGKRRTAASFVWKYSEQDN